MIEGEVTDKFRHEYDRMTGGVLCQDSDSDDDQVVTT